MNKIRIRICLTVHLAFLRWKLSSLYECVVRSTRPLFSGRISGHQLTTNNEVVVPWPWLNYKLLKFWRRSKQCQGKYGLRGSHPSTPPPPGGRSSAWWCKFIMARHVSKVPVLHLRTNGRHYNLRPSHWCGTRSYIRWRKIRDALSFFFFSCHDDWLALDLCCKWVAMRLAPSCPSFAKYQ